MVIQTRARASQCFAATSCVPRVREMTKTVESKRWAGVEGGGTTWVVAVAEGEPDRIVARAEFATTTPRETLALVRDWLDERAAERPFDGLGIATFGPVDLDPTSSTYGFITHSPKPGWADVDVLGFLTANLPRDLPVGFDTDVNAPAMAEFAAMKRDAEAAAAEADDDDADDGTPPLDPTEGITNLAYVTVGTGVGVGVVCANKPVHGLSHPEAGHIRVARLRSDGLPGEPGAFPGVCAYHGDCIEGMAGAAAIAARCGCEVSELVAVADSHPAWDAAAHYVAGLCATLVMVASPQRIVLGGGVLQRKTLITKIRAHLKKQLGGYVRHDFVTSKRGLVEYVAPSRWGNDAGIVGALTLGESASGAAPRRRRKTWKSRVAHFAVGIFSAFTVVKVVNGKITGGRGV